MGAPSALSALWLIDSDADYGLCNDEFAWLSHLLVWLGVAASLGKSQAYIVWGLFHKYVLQYLVYIILGAHIAGALKHQFIDKHSNAFKRMVS